MYNVIVSIVVPIYKVEDYLPNCIESLINQTYSDLEIILVDDGSPDQCGEICDEYAKRDNRIKVIHKENGGLSDARNAGIDIASGKYITFIDSDDFIFLDMIEKLVCLAEQQKADIIECRHIRCNENDTIESIAVPNLKKQFQSFENDEKMKVFFASKGSDTTAWGKLYKTELFSNIRYPVGKIHEDVFTTYKLIHIANKLVITEYIGYVYRVNENSITGVAFSRKRLDSVEGKIKQARFVSKYYPDLSAVAYSEIIYACSQCFRQMVKSNFKDNESYKYIQTNYRKFGKYYLRTKHSISKKAFCLLAMLNIKITEIIFKVI